MIKAARWNGYTFPDFCKLEVDTQEILLAAYMVDNQIQAVLAKEEARKNKARGKQSQANKPIR